MKKLSINAIVAILIIAFTSSCVTNKLTQVPNNIPSNADVEILGPVSGNAMGTKVWVLFVPLGWAKESNVQKIAYKRALKQYENADGIMNQTVKSHKTAVPLIIVSPVFRNIKVEGQAYRFKTKEEVNDAKTK